MPNKTILVLDAGEASYQLVVARSLGSAGYSVHLGFFMVHASLVLFPKYCKGNIFYPDYD
jgi:hypothetical protein